MSFQFPNRNSSRQSHGSFVQRWPVWKTLIALNVAIYLLQIFLSRPANIDDLDLSVPAMEQLIDAIHAADGNDEQELADRQSEIESYLATLPRFSLVNDWLALDTNQVIHGQVWRVVTCGFIHDRHSVWHILFNMLFLFWFGQRLESRYGPREFLCFYIVSLLAASFAYIALDLYTGMSRPAIGASGAVWGVVSLYALLYPYEKIYVYFLFPVQIRFLAMIYFVFDLHPVLLALGGEEMMGNTAHAAHVGGALFGWLYWYRQIRLTKWIDGAIGRKSKWADFGGRESIPIDEVVQEDRSQESRATIIKFPGVFDESNDSRDDQDRSH